MFSLSNKNSISKALKVCQAVAEGDFEARILEIEETGELGELLHSINLMVDRCDAYIRESRACLDYVSRNQYFRLIAETGMTGAFLDAARTINTATNEIKIRNDDFIELGNKFETDMQDIVSSVSHAVSELDVVSDHVNKSSNAALEQSTAVSASAEQASQNMQGVASATEELTNAIAEINSQVVQSSQITSDAVIKSEQMSSEISGLAEASNEISNVMKLISEIAEQTNLLALNATIEAARAGDAGKGFAVVAQEVKALAEQTSKATEDTEQQIKNIQDAMGRSVKANKEISGTIEKVNEISTMIASAIEQQSAATQDIARNVNDAADGTASVSNNVAQIMQAGQNTQKSATEIIETSKKISTQETSLKNLRSGMHSFLENVRKVG